MKQYNIAVTNTTKMALILIFVPLAISSVMVVGFVYFHNIPEWAVVAEVCVVMAVAMAATVYLVKKVVSKGIAVVYNDGFAVDFQEKNIFTPAPFEIKIHQIKNFYIESANGLYYMSFTTSVEPSSFNIESRSRKDEDIRGFRELMEIISAMVEGRNVTPVSEVSGRSTTERTDPVITSVTMYEKPWAKILVVFSFLVLLGVVFMAIFVPGADKVPWWRISALLAFGLPFAYKVYYHNHKKKK